MPYDTQWMSLKTALYKPSYVDYCKCKWKKQLKRTRTTTQLYYCSHRNRYLGTFYCIVNQFSYKKLYENQHLISAALTETQKIILVAYKLTMWKGIGLGSCMHSG